jgi:hypothetical protein
MEIMHRFAGCSGPKWKYGTDMAAPLVSTSFESMLKEDVCESIHMVEILIMMVRLK